MSDLGDKVSFLGLQPEIAKKLKAIGISTVKDLVRYLRNDSRVKSAHFDNADIDYLEEKLGSHLVDPIHQPYDSNVASQSEDERGAHNEHLSTIETALEHLGKNSDKCREMSDRVISITGDLQALSWEIEKTGEQNQEMIEAVQKLRQFLGENARRIQREDLAQAELQRQIECLESELISVRQSYDHQLENMKAQIHSELSEKEDIEKRLRNLLRNSGASNGGKDRSVKVTWLMLRPEVKRRLATLGIETVGELVEELNFSENVGLFSAEEREYLTEKLQTNGYEVEPEMAGESVSSMLVRLEVLLRSSSDSDLSNQHAQQADTLGEFSERESKTANIDDIRFKHSMVSTRTMVPSRQELVTDRVQEFVEPRQVTLNHELGTLDSIERKDSTGPPIPFKDPDIEQADSRGGLVNSATDDQNKLGPKCNGRAKIRRARLID